MYIAYNVVITFSLYTLLLDLRFTYIYDTNLCPLHAENYSVASSNQ